MALRTTRGQPWLFWGVHDTTLVTWWPGLLLGLLNQVVHLVNLSCNRVYWYQLWWLLTLSLGWCISPHFVSEHAVVPQNLGLNTWAFVILCDSLISTYFHSFHHISTGFIIFRHISFPFPEFQTNPKFLNHHHWSPWWGCRGETFTATWRGSNCGNF